MWTIFLIYPDYTLANYQVNLVGQFTGGQLISLLSISAAAAKSIKNRLSPVFKYSPKAKSY
jgi:hypothetical protein